MLVFPAETFVNTILIFCFFLQFFFDLATIPACLAEQKISTQHIYLSDPKKLICTRN